MKKLVFDELMLLSFREKKARRISFHPEMTVIQGANDTGKSHLIKSIYATLGANPQNIHPRWKDADVKSLLRFTFNDCSFSMLADSGAYTLFDSEKNILCRTQSATKGLAPFYRDFFDFKLRLMPKGSNPEPQTPPPSFLFLPFLIDQDAGWSKSWNSFSRLQQFPSFKKDLCDYHAGIRPNEYYENKIQMAEFKNKLQEPQRQLAALNSIKKDLVEKLSSATFTFDLNDYQEQVKELLVEAEKIKNTEELYKKELSALYDERVLVDSQITLATDAKSELSKDFAFAAENILDEAIECPTCGCIHENSFVERFEIARDEERCDEMLMELQARKAEVGRKINKLENEYALLKSDLCRVEEILSRKKGELKLGDIIESEGHKQVRSIVQSDIDKANREIMSATLEIKGIEDAQKKFGRTKRTKEIMELYRGFMKEFLYKLEVHNLSPKDYSRIDCSIKESGSDAPRALLAYFYSVLSVMEKYSSTPACPVVIDAPHQQDQDIANSRRILEFIRSHNLGGRQHIVGLVNNFGVDFCGKTINLTEKNSLLQRSEYSDVYEDIRGYIDASLMSSLVEAQ